MKKVSMEENLGKTKAKGCIEKVAKEMKKMPS